MALTESPADRCTRRCTTEYADPLDAIARAVALVASLPLTEAERADVLARVLAGQTSAPAPAVDAAMGRGSPF